MDLKNEFDLDISMETKPLYKLRSSLKKRKSRNPLGSLDVSEVVTADITLAPRRVSFAASNYVKPFIDDPEKNTIWDNTYEEEANQTDSTKSENVCLSELKSHCQVIQNLDIHEDYRTNIYHNEEVEHMEVSCFNQTIIDDQIREKSSDSSMEITTCIPSNIDVKNITQLTSFNMELTCQWKNNIMQSNIVPRKDKTINEAYLLANATVHQEEDMSMTCCFGKVETIESRLLPAYVDSKMETTNYLPSQSGCLNQPNRTRNTSLATATVSRNPENITAKEEKIYLANQSETEFTCVSPSSILETVDQLKGMENNFTALSSFVDKENIMAVPSKKDKWTFADQSEMEFTCAFPSNIFEKENNVPAMSAVPNIAENKEHVLAVSAKNQKISPDQSDMELTCAFQNKVFEAKGAGNTSLALISVNVENKENIPINYDDKEKLSDRSDLEFTSAFSSKVLEKANQPEGTGYGQNKENIFPTDFSMCHDKKEKASQPSMMNFTCSFPGEISEPANQQKMFNNLMKTSENKIISDQPSDNLEMSHTSIKNSISNNFEIRKETDFFFIKPEVNTEIIKPVKVREFGNIPIAVDVTDQSIEHTVNECAKPVSDTSRQYYNPKEETYTVRAGQPEMLAQIKQTTPRKVTLVPALHQNIASEMTKKQNQTPCGTLNNIAPDSLRTSEGNEETDLSNSFKGKTYNNCNIVSSTSNKSLTGANISNQLEAENKIEELHFNEQNNEVEKAEAEESIALLDSQEGSVLINSITLPDIDEHISVDVNYFHNGTPYDLSSNKENDNYTVEEPVLQMGEKNPATKVIYSEPMKVKLVHDELPSMQASGMNPFNFNSFSSMEVSQPIQTSFSKPSFAKTEEFKNDKWQSRCLPEPNMLEISEKNELIKTNSCNSDYETLKTESFLKNYQDKIAMAKCKFQPINYTQISEVIKESRETSEKVEELLLNFKLPDIVVLNLEEEIKKISLGTTSEDNSEDSILEAFESAEDNNRSVPLEQPKSLHEKVVEVCSRSNTVLNIERFEDNMYIFSAVYECILIYVEMHPDGRVTEIKTASSLKDSADVLFHFVVKIVLDKLKYSTLQSYLGPYYDVLSLLDHICLTVDEVMEFHYEFLSLQKVYSSLTLNFDYSISFEFINESVPLWWKIRLSDMTAVNRINNLEILHFESMWGNASEEQINQILRNTSEGVDSLRTFMSNVYKYFERTTLRHVKEQ